MNWQAFWKAMVHAAIGGAAVGGVMVAQNPSAPITSGNILLPIIASAATSVLSFLSQSPTQPPANPPGPTPSQFPVAK